MGAATKDDEVLGDPVIKELASKYKKTPGQIVLRWAIQQGLAIIPKSSKLSRIQENRDV